MHSPLHPRYLSAQLVHREAQDGDVLLFRRPGLIAVAGRSIYSHAGMYATWDGDPFVL